MAYLMSYEPSSFFNEAFSKYPCPSFDYSSSPFLRKLAYANVSRVDRSIHIVKGCFDPNVYSNSVFLKTKARGYSSLPRSPLLADLEDISRRGDGLDAAVIDVDSRSLSAIPTKPLSFQDRRLSQKLVVAVDVDEVLGNFVSALNRFIADRYSSNYSVYEYHVMSFLRYGTVHEMKNAIKDQTVEWMEKYYGGVFEEIQFGNHFALDGLSRPKSEICRRLGAKVLIDDNPRYAMECADAGMRVLILYYENSYPWCKTAAVDGHPLITRVTNWQQVEQELVSLLAS